MGKISLIFVLVLNGCGCATVGIDKCHPNSGPPPIECEIKEPKKLREEVVKETLDKFERLCMSLEVYSKIIVTGNAAKEIREGLRNCYWVFNNGQ